MPTTNGSPVYAGVVPDADAEIVTQIKAYGGTVFGKTVSTEFAWREPGPHGQSVEQGAYAGRFFQRFGRRRCGWHSAFGAR